jgi:hypothetical protein
MKIKSNFGNTNKSKISEYYVHNNNNNNNTIRINNDNRIINLLEILHKDGISTEDLSLHRMYQNISYIHDVNNDNNKNPSRNSLCISDTSIKTIIFPGTHEEEISHRQILNVKKSITKIGKERNFLKLFNFNRNQFIKQLNANSTCYHINIEDSDSIASQTIAGYFKHYITFMKKSTSELIKHYQLIDTILERNESFHDFKSTILDILWIFETMDAIIHIPVDL